MNKKERYKKVLEYFQKIKLSTKSELNYENAYELCVSVILAAQCTDVRVNKITPDFFNEYPDTKALSKAEVSDINRFIKSCSYHNNKAKHLLGMAQTLETKFSGEFPSEVKQLEELPGIGRKSANVIAAAIFNKPVMAVDTHVFRVSNRIGLTDNSKNPLQTERELIKYIPEELVAKAHHWLVLHGRYVCKARKPQCEECGITDFCKFNIKEQIQNNL